MALLHLRRAGAQLAFSSPMEAESGAVIGTTCHVRRSTCWSILLTSEKLLLSSSAEAGGFFLGRGGQYCSASRVGRCYHLGRVLTGSRCNESFLNYRTAVCSSGVGDDSGLAA